MAKIKVDIWEASERKLFKASIAAIKELVREYPEDEICCFFFDCDEPRYGHIYLGFDTLENNVRTAKKLEEFAVQNRREMLQGELIWKYTKHALTSPALSPFNTDSGDFEHGEFAEVDYPAWERLAENGDYPKNEETDNDYMESNARLTMWRVAERLVAENAFAALNWAAPFVIGYSLHDEEPTVLRILNWPA